MIIVVVTRGVWVIEGDVQVVVGEGGRECERGRGGPCQCW